MDTPNPHPSAEGAKGSLVGSIIVILILVIGAIYYLSARRTNAPVSPPPAGSETEVSATTL